MLWSVSRERLVSGEGIHEVVVNISQIGQETLEDWDKMLLQEELVMDNYS